MAGESQTIAGEVSSMRLSVREIGMSTEARKLLNAQLKIEAWARKEIAKYPDQAAAINAAATGYKSQITAAMTDSYSASTSGVAGTKAAFTSFVASSQDAASQVQHTWSSVWNGLTNQLTTALTGGRTSFRAFARGIFADLTKMVVKDAIMAPLASGLGQMFGLGTGNASALGFFGSLMGFAAGATPKSGGTDGFNGSMGNIGWGSGPSPIPTAGRGSILGSAFGDLKSGLGIFNTFKGLAGIGSTLSSAWSGSLLQKGILGLGSLIGFANGGIMTAMGPLPLNKYAGGGVASSPQVALFGEGRMPEAYVPLPDGRSIPVQMRGGGGAGTVFHMNTTINHNGGPGFDPAEAAREMHRQFQQMIDRRMIQQQRDGGLMATNGTSYR